MRAILPRTDARAKKQRRAPPQRYRRRWLRDAAPAIGEVRRTVDAVPTARLAPSITMGAASGAVTVLLFTLLHDLLISDIWFNVGPMVIAGAMCGASLVWSYRAAVADHTPRRWLAYVGACSGLLVALAIVSLVVLEPRFTMTELLDNDEALGLLLPPALPLMGAATLVGTGVLWLWLGRRPGALVPLLIGQLLLVFFVGHNLAILGLIEMSSEVLVGLAEFVGLTLLLGGLFAAGVLGGDAAGRGTTGQPPAPQRPTTRVER